MNTNKSKLASLVLLPSLMAVSPLTGFNENFDPEWKNPDWYSPTSAQSSGIEGSYEPQNYENPNNFPGGTSTTKAMNDPFGDNSYGPPPNQNSSFDSHFGPP